MNTCTEIQAYRTHSRYHEKGRNVLWITPRRTKHRCCLPCEAMLSVSFSQDAADIRNDIEYQTLTQRIGPSSRILHACFQTCSYNNKLIAHRVWKDFGGKKKHDSAAFGRILGRSREANMRYFESRLNRQLHRAWDQRSTEPSIDEKETHKKIFVTKLEE